MSKFDPESRERCKRVDDQPTPATGEVIALVGIRLHLDSAVDIDRVSDPLVLPPSMRLASLGTGWGIAESTTGECLLHHSASSSASRAAVQPR